MHRRVNLGLVLLAMSGGLAVEAQEGASRGAGHRISLAQPLSPEATLEQRLEAKGTFEAEKATLQSFAHSLARALGTNVLVASKKLEEAAVDLDMPMTYRLKNVRVKTALKLILGEMYLTYFTEDNVLIITTAEDAGSRLVTRVYDCCDLLALQDRVYGRSSADEILELIEVTVHPDSWADGNNRLSSDVKGLVVILQTQEMHEDIEKLLNQLHKAAGIEGKVKVQK